MHTFWVTAKVLSDCAAEEAKFHRERAETYTREADEHIRRGDFVRAGDPLHRSNEHHDTALHYEVAHQAYGSEGPGAKFQLTIDDLLYFRVYGGPREG